MKMRLFKTLVIGCLSGFAVQASSGRTQSFPDWPEASVQAKPGVRWWWPGSAVDKANLTRNLESLSKAGIGSVEITPIYGVQGLDSLEIPYLSPRWMEMLRHTEAEAKRLAMQVDMNGATGWPFGGPQITPEYAACKSFIQKYTVQAGENRLTIQATDAKQRSVSRVEALLFVSGSGQRIQIPLTTLADTTLSHRFLTSGTLYALFSGRTFQQVKRAAPGGQGLVMNHFSKPALDVFLKRYDEAFEKTGTSWPATFFNDSYEVYGADWTPDFFQEFQQRRGYDLRAFLPELNYEGDSLVRFRVVCDYRETISDLLLDNFTVPWTAWAHQRGIQTRNQAHGSPGNLLDLYAAMDIPECESYGANRYDIPGLRLDTRYKASDSNPVTLKFASSAAHVSGKVLTSCESMTWLTEHFRTSLSQIKPEVDLLFLNGINRIFYHGSPYTPQNAPWPGWLFYASIQLNSNNTIFRDMNGLNDYVTRIQSFMQQGSPDNELLVYLPLYDIWQNFRGTNYIAFDIHKLGEKLPEFSQTVFSIRKMGYDLDYISDKQLQNCRFNGTGLITDGGHYRMILVPDCKVMPLTTLQKLLNLAKDGATVAFLNDYPGDVPGWKDAEQREETLRSVLAGLKKAADGDGYTLQAHGKGWIVCGADLAQILEKSPANATRESMTNDFGLSFVRRSNSDGHTYFVSQLSGKTVDGWVPVAKADSCVFVFDPLTGRFGQAQSRIQDGKFQVYLQLHPGQSVVLRTFDKTFATNAFYPVWSPAKGAFRSDKTASKPDTLQLSGKWQFCFTDGVPIIPGSFTMQGAPTPWTSLSADSAGVFAGTGQYKLRFQLPAVKVDDWLLDFGALGESARVYVNGQFAGICWSLPPCIHIGKWLKPGKQNTLEIDVTNLPANRIAFFDRQGVRWRIFKEINFVDVMYQNTTYGDWPVMPSGLLQTPRLIPLNNEIKPQTQYK